jgi:arabinan endo-1,5-alpha-L-arabinosidase
LKEIAVVGNKLLPPILLAVVIIMAVPLAMSIASAPTDNGQNSPAAKPATAEQVSAEGRLAQLGKRGVAVHDPSTIVKCKDEFWLFYTGRGTPSYRSKDLVRWERGPAAFSRAPAWAAEAVPANRGGLDFWAPDVIRLGDRYLLYYSVSTFGKNTSAIALATNPTLDPADPAFLWTDQGIVIQSNDKSDFNTIDPAAILDADGKLWMSFGSFWSGIRLIELDPKTGKRIAADSPVHSLARSDSIEASYIFRHGDYYYLFVNWGTCCRGADSTYNIRVGRCRAITGPYLDKEGKDLRTGGGTLLLATDGQFIGPGHAGIIQENDKFWMSMHFYDGSRRGAGTLAIRPLSWDAEGWPVVGEIKDAPKDKP